MSEKHAALGAGRRVWGSLEKRRLSLGLHECPGQRVSDVGQQGGGHFSSGLRPTHTPGQGWHTLVAWESPITVLRRQDRCYKVTTCLSMRGTQPGGTERGWRRL